MGMVTTAVMGFMVSELEVGSSSYTRRAWTPWSCGVPCTTTWALTSSARAGESLPWEL